MRASPWRSLARLPPLAVLVVAACSPNIDLTDRAPPCASGNYECPATGYCVPYPPDGSSGDQNDASTVPSGIVNNCLLGYTIRLGGTRTIPVPFVHAVDEVTVVSVPLGLTATPAIDEKTNKVSLNVTVGHGSDLLGQVTVTIKTKNPNGGSQRDITIFVSPITATAGANGGSDANTGASDSPFLTFQAAAAVAEYGDTIYLRGIGPFGYPNEDDDVASPTVTLKNGVIVRSPTTATRSALHMPIVLEGGATLDDLDIEDQRLTITAPNSVVTLQGGTIVGKGIEIAAAASASQLYIYNTGKDGEIRNDDPSKPSLLISANGASVTIDNGGAIRSDVKEMAAIRSDGVNATVTINGGAVIENSAGGPAVDLVKAVSLEVNGVTFHGDVEISDPSCVASFEGSEFLFGDSNGEIIFGGSDLSVATSTFDGLAVVQNNPASHAKLRDSQITGYTQAGYRLIAGYLDAGTMDDAGNNTFADYLYGSSSPGLPTTRPSALSIEVLDPPANGVVGTSSASTFNGMQAVTCTASQVMGIAGIVTIMPPDVGDWVFVNFY